MKVKDPVCGMEIEADPHKYGHPKEDEHKGHHTHE